MDLIPPAHRHPWPADVAEIFAIEQHTPPWADCIDRYGGKPGRAAAVNALVAVPFDIEYLGARLRKVVEKLPQRALGVGAVGQVDV